MLNFQYKFYETMEEVRKHIQEDEGHCVQQVCYSTFHDCLTQINFINNNYVINLEDL